VNGTENVTVEQEACHGDFRAGQRFGPKCDQRGKLIPETDIGMIAPDL